MKPFAIFRSSYILDVLLCSGYIYEKILLIKHAISNLRASFPNKSPLHVQIFIKRKEDGDYRRWNEFPLLYLFYQLIGGFSFCKKRGNIKHSSFDYSRSSMKYSCMKNTISESHPSLIRQFDVVCEKIHLRVAPKVHIFCPVFIYT